MERVAGIKPASPAWKAGVIIIIRYPHTEVAHKVRQLSESN